MKIDINFESMNHESDKIGDKSLKVYFTLFLISMIDFGSSYVYDIPQSLEIAFENELHIDTQKNLLFYSAYSLPNLFVSLLGGMLINKYGFRKCLVSYSLCVCTGHLLFCFAAMNDWYTGMLIGRVISGLGSENLMITQYFTSHMFFEKTYLSIAVGLDMSLSYLASVIAFYLIPKTYIVTGSLSTCLMYTLIPPLLSFSMVIVFLLLYRNDKSVKDVVEYLEKDEEKIRSEGSGNYLVYQSEDERRELDEEKEMGHSGEERDPRSNENPKPSFKLKDIKKFPVTFWILTLATLFLSPAYYQLINVSTKLISVKFDLSYDEAKSIPPTIPLVLMIAIPLITRYIVYPYGRKPLYMVASPLIGGAAICLLIWKVGSPYIFTMSFGLFYALYQSVFWTSIAKTAEKSHVDVGLGIANTLQNLSSFLWPILLGIRYPSITVDNMNEFLFVLLSMITVGLFIGISLVIADKMSNSELSIPEKKTAAETESGEPH